MTIERKGRDGPVIFMCNGRGVYGRGCPEVDETHCSDFTSALAKVKRHGWKVVRKAQDWWHLCPTCAEDIK